MTTKRKVPVLSVGLFLLAGLTLLGWMILQYGGTNKVQEGYVVNVEFKDASGIIKGGLVRLAGANVGYVLETPELTPNNTVTVPLVLQENLELPANTRFEIISLSLLGDKAIYLRIPKEASPNILKEGDSIVGKSPDGLGDVQSKAEQILDKTNETFADLTVTLNEYRGVAEKLNVSLERLNTTLLDESKLEEVSVTIANVKEASQSFRELSDSLHPLADDARLTMAEFRKVAKTTNETVTDASTVIADTKGIITNLDTRMEQLGPALEELPKTLATYSRVGQSLEQSLNSKDGLLTTLTKDKEVTDDTKTFVKNLRTNGILGYKDDSDPEQDDPRDRYRGIRR